MSANNTSSDSENMSLGKYLYTLRTDAKLFQEDVAKVLGVKRVTYSAYETGRITPSTGKLLTLASFYGISAQKLLAFTDASFEAADEDILSFQIKASKEGDLLYYYRHLKDSHKEIVFYLVKGLYDSR